MRRVVLVLLLAACAPDGRLGHAGHDGASCSVTQATTDVHGRVDADIQCADGSEARLAHGEMGPAGLPGPPGAPGRPGMAPPSPSQRLRVVQPAGCPGGVVLQTGPDRDGDGRLDDGEATGPSYALCPPAPSCGALDGALTFTNSWEMAEFFEAGCTEVLDDVTVAVPGLSDLSLLRNLQHVGGTLTITGTAITNLDELAALREVHRLVLRGNPELQSLQGLSHLASASALELIGLPQLHGLAGLEGLSQVADLTIDGTGVADTVPLDALRITSSLTVRGNAELVMVTLPGIHDSNLDSLEITDDGALRSLAGLRPTTASTLVIARNPLLPSCEAQQVADALARPPLVLDLSGNGGVMECP